MGGTAPANQLRLSFAGSEDGEAETATCRQVTAPPIPIFYPTAEQGEPFYF